MTTPLLNGKFKVAELVGGPLDVAVAKARGLKPRLDRIYPDGEPFCVVLTAHEDEPRQTYWKMFCPSTNWEHGGPLIESEQIEVGLYVRSHGFAYPPPDSMKWTAGMTAKAASGHEGELCITLGPKPLIAAMRAYVIGSLGPEVDL